MRVSKEKTEDRGSDTAESKEVPPGMVTEVPRQPSGQQAKRVTHLDLARSKEPPGGSLTGVLNKLRQKVCFSQRDGDKLMINTEKA